MLEALGFDVTAEGVYQALLSHPAWGVADLSRHLHVPDHVVRSAWTATAR